MINIQTLNFVSSLEYRANFFTWAKTAHGHRILLSIAAHFFNWMDQLGVRKEQFKYAHSKLTPALQVFSAIRIVTISDSLIQRVLEGGPSGLITEASFRDIAKGIVQGTILMYFFVSDKAKLAEPLIEIGVP